MNSGLPSRISGALALLGLLVLTGWSAPAFADTLVEHRLAQQPSSTRGWPGLGGLAAGFGYVAWLERSAPGGRQRIVVRRNGVTKWGGWMSGSLAIDFRRGVDLKTGRVVVRLVLRRQQSDGTVISSLRSPTTLRSSATRWREPRIDPGSPRAWSGDGVQEVTAVNEPDPKGPAGVVFADGLPMTVCRVTAERAGTPLASIPPIADCAVRSVDVQGSLVALASSVVSQTDSGYEFSTRALDLFDLNAPERGWRRVATGGNGKGGSTGLQQFCLLDDGLAVLSGERPSYDYTDPRTWTLSYVPANPALPGWTAAAPQLAAIEQISAADPSMACSRSSIYGRYDKPVGRKTDERLSSRVVRLSHSS